MSAFSSTPITIKVLALGVLFIPLAIQLFTLCSNYWISVKIANKEITLNEGLFRFCEVIKHPTLGKIQSCFFIHDRSGKYRNITRIYFSLNFYIIQKFKY